MNDALDTALLLPEAGEKPSKPYRSSPYTVAAYCALPYLSAEPWTPPVTRPPACSTPFTPTPTASLTGWAAGLTPHFPMPLKTTEWNLLLDRPGLLATLDTLRGYSYPPGARQALCQQHALSEAEFDAVLQLHTTTIHKPGNCYSGRGRPPGPVPRDGWDLLLYQPGLREALGDGRAVPPLEAFALARLQRKFRLTPSELVRVFNAHAELLARA